MRGDAFDIAKVLAEKVATSSAPLVTRYKHSAVILDRNNKIISKAKNYFAGTSIVSEEGTDIDKTVHAEIAALAKVNIRRLEGATIIICGRTKVRYIRSAPCASCHAVLKKLKVRKMFYTLMSQLDTPIWAEGIF